MDDLRIGRIARALRHRLVLRQSDVADRLGVSQGQISLFERGWIEAMPLRQVRRILGAVDAELVLIVRWRGGDLDRLLDAAHAQLGDELVRLLESDGWLVVPEVSFSIYGERGSIDLLAWHATTRTLLVIELKSEIASVEETLRRHDVKVRLAPDIARDRFGWPVTTVARLLALPEHRSTRRQVERTSRLFGSVYPARNRAIKRWLERPTGGLSGLLFLSDTSGDRGMRARPIRKRVRTPVPRSARAAATP